MMLLYPGDAAIVMILVIQGEAEQRWGLGRTGERNHAGSVTFCPDSGTIQSMDKLRALRKIAGEIARCPLCKKGGTGKAVPGEGNPDARIVFVGEAPGKEEAAAGRPFIGRSGRFLRRA